MKATAIYARVSTEEQVRNTSLDTQTDACRKFAEQNGYFVVHEVREDFSGARLDRPGLTKLRDMAAAGELAVIVVYDPDRLSRSNAHMWMLMEEFERRKVQLLFVNTPREDTPEGNMLFGMRALFAEYEREKIKERTRRGKERCARNGQVICQSKCSYGYRYIGGKGQGRYEVIEEEAAVIRQIFQWLVNDRVSLGEIVMRLHHQGVPTKKGGKWHRSTLSGILKNEVYIGTFYWNRRMSVLPKQGKEGRKTERSRVVFKDRSEWIAVPVPTIIDPDTFQLAQEQLELNKERSQRNTKTPYLFRGMLRCGLCGRACTGARTSATRRVYRCRGYSSRDVYLDVANRCQSKQHNATYIETKAWEKLSAYISDPKRVERGLQGRDAAIREEEHRDDNDLVNIQNVLQRIGREEERLLTAYQQGVIELSMLQESLAKLKQRKAEQEAERTKVLARSDQRKKMTANLQAIQAISEKAQRGFKNMDWQQRRNVLEVLQARIAVYPHKLEIEGLFTDRLTVLLEDQKPRADTEIVYTKFRSCAAIQGRSSRQAPTLSAGGS